MGEDTTSQVEDLKKRYKYNPPKINVVTTELIFGIPGHSDVDANHGNYFPS